MDGPDDSQAFLSFHLMQIFVSSPQLRTLLAVSVFFYLFWIDTRYRKPQRNEAYKLMSSSMIALQILTGKVPTPSMIQKIGKLMHKRGYKSIHRNSGDYYKVVEISYDQQQMYITLDEEFKTDESKSSQPSDSKQLELPF
ncbi:MAG: DUF3874 domain-containing protein [Prevotella sp.]|nr:DUF3874 domain-containing protein [Prevotella sp.]